MKTKPFLLATSGATVDGRTIDAAMLQQMADSYDPATYAARLNIEHLRGISPGGPFGAYGDVLELSTAEVTVNFNGKDEKRLGLFGVFEVTEDAKALNDAGQKLYPSIEINPNFADKGFAYLMGCALTDSPASIATEKLQFNRQQPGNLTLGADQASQAFGLEFADAGNTDAADSLLGKLGAMIDGFAAKFGAQGEPEARTIAKPKEGEPDAFSVADLKPVLEGMAETFSQAVSQLQRDAADQADQVALRFKALEAKFETTPANNHTARPVAAGAHGDKAVTDC